MIYLDSSVALARLLADRLPHEHLWQQQLVSSRLLEYEVWNRIHARRLERSHGDAARGLIGRVALLELVTPVLVRALAPLPETFNQGYADFRMVPKDLAQTEAAPMPMLVRAWS